MMAEDLPDTGTARARGGDVLELLDLHGGGARDAQKADSRARAYTF
jgi:hypothetical protein